MSTVYGELAGKAVASAVRALTIMAVAILGLAVAVLGLASWVMYLLVHR